MWRSQFQPNELDGVSTIGTGDHSNPGRKNDFLRLAHYFYTNAVNRAIVLVAYVERGSHY